MVARWYSSITTFDDVLAFQQHIREATREHRRRENRSYPGSIRVSGVAYPVIKDRVDTEIKRRRHMLLGTILGLFTGHALTGFVSQLSGVALEMWRNRGDEIRSAASLIASTYYNVSNDNGSSMTLNYVFDDDNMDAGGIPSIY